jgi:hypothetical protein
MTAHAVLDRCATDPARTERRSEPRDAVRLPDRPHLAASAFAAVVLALLADAGRTVIKVSSDLVCPALAIVRWPS